MLISSEKEQIFLPSDGAEDSLKSSPAGSSPDSLDRFSPVSLLPDSTPLPSSYTDVNVVPEHRKNELEQFISNLEGEIVQLKLKEKSLNEKRRAVLNKILDIKGSIRVFCRVRPFHSTNQRRVHEPVSTGLDKIAVKSAGIGKEFRFDKVFHQVASQDDVFVEVEPTLRSALDGHNVCIVAYGQTGTGKTFTMDGSNGQPGIVPRALEELFCQASLDNSASVTFSMSMLEVYMGNLKDLLAMRPSCRTYEPVSRCNLNIQTDPKGLVEIEGLTEVQIPDISKAKWWYSKGRRVRSTSWTSVNDASSRSHCLTRITIFRRSNPLEAKAEVSKLWMVDLGGSERLLKTGATGQTLDEGRAINLSLSALGDVIAALRRKKGHVPYRNSKLTQILKDSLGYGSKVLMLVHVSPYEDDVGETICSLSFAYRARAIESNREVPEDLKKQRERRISEIEEEMREMEEERQKIRNQIKNAEFLLSENKRLFSISYGVCEDEDKNARTPKEDLQKIIESPRINDEAIKRNTTHSLPRFMTSTVASRQRHSASEREIIGRARTVRSETRSSVQFSASQSLSYSDIRSRAILRNSSKKSQHVEAKALLTDGPKFSNLDFKTTSMPKSKIVISSDPNLSVTLGRHRRRMSDLI
ncbi:P-loop containing nucleoside triphosphate hydrolases superfamily protein [Tripterygium wilfordii]|uniref:P-loop containing nucleoside triphosphate hydrolases superfamily protein n=1 Tax=Tripterygium wilfordii TaxID=458696 RepID=A0A7J7D2K4_TRIWF|nr:kinesin-like protein KIN-14U [Tripterygium wilfordii]KAF5740553.1 P-loop containing nucleoside triphosphate hydrolases superfamily protein [Tripterygium wilfordii]